MISPVPVRSHTSCRLSIVHGIRLEGSLFGIRARAFARLSLLSRGSHLSISGFSRCSRCCQSDLVALSWVTAERLWVCVSAYSACLAPRSLRVPPTHTHTPARLHAGLPRNPSGLRAHVVFSLGSPWIFTQMEIFLLCHRSVFIYSRLRHTASGGINASVWFSSVLCVS